MIPFAPLAAEDIDYRVIIFFFKQERTTCLLAAGRDYWSPLFYTRIVGEEIKRTISSGYMVS
jgi:hypothetical protein